MQKLEWKYVSYDYVEIKTIELTLDFTKHMQRYQLFQPRFGDGDHTEVARKLLDRWTEVVVTAKSWQQNIEDMSQWPAEGVIPWDIQEPGHMPVVVWIKKQWTGN